MRLFRAHLWVDVPFKNIFMKGCDCLDDLKGWVRMCVTGCGCMGKIVKPEFKLGNSKFPAFSQ